MTHLTRAELVDFIESSPDLPAARRRHVEACEACRAATADLRAAAALALTDDIPEPSPLFWDHFSARVGEAVRSDTVGPSAATRGWRHGPIATWAAAATMAGLVLITVVWRTTLHAPAPAAAPGVTAVVVQPAADDVESDEAWAVVRAAAVDLRWEDVHAAGISAHPGAVEEVARELSAGERSELARLLDEELKRNGA